MSGALNNNRDIFDRIRNMQKEIDELKRMPRVKDAVVDQGYIKFQDDNRTLRVAIGHLEGLPKTGVPSTYPAGTYGWVTYNSAGAWIAHSITT